MKIKENKRKITTFSLFVEQIASSCFAVARFVGSLPASGFIRGPPRDLDPVGSTQYDGYYFAKEIIAEGTISPRK